MTQARRESQAPWIVAGIAGMVLVALVVVFFAVLLPYRRDHRPGASSFNGKSCRSPSRRRAARCADR